jgi:hypothetical protein
MRNSKRSDIRASIIFTDDEGNTWEHELKLIARPDGNVQEARPKQRKTATRERKLSEPRKGRSLDPDFSLPIRPFIVRHTKGASGPQKFAILVAWIAKGDTKAEVPFSDIEKQWNKMTQLMGGAFNPAHASRAKNKGWVDSPKHGVYKVLGEWRNALPSG